MSADIFSNILGWLVMGTGNDNNTWGTNWNSSVGTVLETAIAGLTSYAVVGGSTDLSTNPPPAGPSGALPAILQFTGMLMGQNQVVKVPNLSKVWIINNLLGLAGFALTIQTPSGTPVVIPNGWQTVWCDGNNNIYVGPQSSWATVDQTGVLTTGAMQFRPTTPANDPVPGWVVANAQTIGSASSSATFASSTAKALFLWHWTNFSNTQCPVSGGRGANALADWNNNKTIQVLDWRGKGPIGVDTMGGSGTTLLSGVPVTSGNATTPGSVIGENLHQLVTSELAAHTHGNTFNDNTHTNPNSVSDNTHFHGYTELIGGAGTVTAGGNFYNLIPANTGVNNQATTSLTNAASFSNASITNASAGGGGFHNTVHLSMTGYWYLKL